jgi:hypothetical protein
VNVEPDLVVVGVPGVPGYVRLVADQDVYEDTSSVTVNDVVPLEVPTLPTVPVPLDDA